MDDLLLADDNGLLREIVIRRLANIVDDDRPIDNPMLQFERLEDLPQSHAERDLLE
jgi:hypothetical protein